MFVNVSMSNDVNSHHPPLKNDGNGISYTSRTIVHPKLEMTEPGDADEQEADEAAYEVMNGKVFRMFSVGGTSGGMVVSSQMESQLNQLQGGGQAMPDGLRSMMERGFDRDFSQVRLHTDGEAANLSSSIHAKAFTHGNDIYFNQGQYAPETSEGQRLVAHELAHVAQGGGKVGRNPDVTIQDVSSPDISLGEDLTTQSPDERSSSLPGKEDESRANVNGIAAKILDMQKDEYGNYHAIVDCIQRYFGYMEEYDKIFAYFTSMQRKKYFFNSMGTNFSIWAWKGDYLNLGLGTELGIYTGNSCNEKSQVCLSDTENLTMDMAVTKLQYKDYNCPIDTSFRKHFWVTTFVPRSEEQYSTFMVPLLANMIMWLLPVLATLPLGGIGLPIIKNMLFEIRNTVDGEKLDSKNITSEFKIKYDEGQEPIIESFKGQKNPESDGWSFDKGNRTMTFLFKGEGDPFDEDVTRFSVCCYAMLSVLSKIIPVLFKELALHSRSKFKAVWEFLSGVESVPILGKIGVLLGFLPFALLVGFFGHTLFFGNSSKKFEEGE